MVSVVERFFTEVYNKNYGEVSLLIQQGNDINVIYDGKRALHIACVRNDFNMVKLLLDLGADPNIEVRDETPLNIAIRTGNEDIVELLIKNKARVNILNNGYSKPLFDAWNTRNLNIMKMLLKEGANANEVDFAGKPILNHVSGSTNEEDIDFVETLLEYGANPNIDDGEVGTALHNACKSNNILAMYELLKNDASILQLNNNDEFPLHIACSSNSTKAVAMLLKQNEGILNKSVYSQLSYYNKGNKQEGMTPLQIARINKNKDMVDLLQERNKNAIVQCILNSRFEI